MGGTAAQGGQSDSSHHDGDTLTDAVTNWATPLVSTNSGIGYPDAPQDKSRLMDQAAAWSTPTASDIKGPDQIGRRSPGDDRLATQVARSWHTPTINPQAPNSSSNIVDGPTSLQEQAQEMWPTPAASEARQGFQRRPDGMASDQNQQSLSTKAALWATPDAEAMNDRENPETFLARQAEAKAKGINGNGFGMPLAMQAKVATRDWSTPGANDGSRGADRVRRDNGQPNSSLKTDIENWPTPAVRDFKGTNLEPFADRGGGSKGEQLPNFVEHKWRTPQTMDAERGSNGTWVPQPKAGDHSLRHQAGIWQTPSVASATGGQANRGGDRQEEVLLAGQARDVSSHLPLTTSTDGQTSSKPARTLNPLFVEWLMTWPEGWTTMCLGLNSLQRPEWTVFESSEMGLSLWKARWRGELRCIVLLDAPPAQPSLF